MKKVTFSLLAPIEFGISMCNQPENIDIQLYNNDLKLSRINDDLCKKISFRADIERFNCKIGPILAAHVIKAKALNMK